MQEAAIGVQSNLMASNKLKMEEEKTIKDKKKMKEENPSSSKSLSAEEKIDQMSNLIKELASKMSKLEVENKLAARANQNESNRNQAPFRRPFQPQKILQRPRRNVDDKNVQPPLDNFVEEEQQGNEEENEEINHVGETSHSTCLKLQEYEDRSRICLFSDEMNAQIYAQNDKK